MNWSVIQWIVGLSLMAAGAAATALAARVLHGRALGQLEAWKSKMVEAKPVTRIEALEKSVKEFEDADLILHAKDTDRSVKEIQTWRQEATEQLDEIEKETYAAAAVKEALASSASTTKGTQPYRKADR